MIGKVERALRQMVEAVADGHLQARTPFGAEVFADAQSALRELEKDRQP